MLTELRNDVVVLAGAREVRIVGSTREAESELASGFLPAVVLLGPGMQRPAVLEAAARLGARPSRARIPVLRFSGDAEQIRLTLVNPPDQAEPSEPEDLTEVLMVLEELANELCLLERWRRKDGRYVTWAV